MEEVMKVGERRLHLLRAFNAREGLGKEADTLPKKLFTPLEGKGPQAGVAMTHEEFDTARDSYYRLAGCDPATGHPTKEKLASLGLDWVGTAR
jgi:aldehyde:ferredoxin oxidoreductase